MEPFQILSRKNILNKPFIQVEKQRVVLPNGKETDWYITQGKGAVIVIPLLKTGEILLQRTYKHGCQNIIVEFCAGMIEKNEDISNSAVRELQEETGYVAEKIELIGECFANPTGSPQKYFIFLARGCEKKCKTHFDDAEQIENFTAENIEEVEKILLNPKTQTSTPALAAFSFLRKNL